MTMLRFTVRMVMFSVLVSCLLLFDITNATVVTTTTIAMLQNATPSNDSDVGILAERPERLTTTMETESTFYLNVNISCDWGSDLVLTFTSTRDAIFTIKGSANDAVRISCPGESGRYVHTGANESLPHSSAISDTYFNKTVEITLRGNRLGVADLLITLQNSTAVSQYDQQRQNVSEWPLLQEALPVAVLRPIRLLDRVFLAVVPFFLVLVMIGFGCKLDMDVVKECVKKPLAPGIGFGCQYLIMPLLGFTLANVVPTGDRGISLGIFLCGICPGGGVSNIYTYLLDGDVSLSITMTFFSTVASMGITHVRYLPRGGVSNIYTYLLDGDVSLSITMTFFSTVASMGMMPLWIYTLGRVLTDGQTNLTIPYLDLLQITALVTGSLLVGIVIKYKCHRVAAFFIKILKPITIVLVLIMVSVGIYSNMYIFKMFQPVHFLSGCLLPYCGYALGGATAAIFRLPWCRVKTVAIETGLQNSGVAFILLMKSFPPPYSDIAALAPAANALMTPLPLLLVSIVYLIYKRCTRKYEEVGQNTDAEKIGALTNGTTDGKAVLMEKLSTV